jgi:hypothetical protein
VREIIAGTAVELHLCAFLARNDPKPVMLDLRSHWRPDGSSSVLVGRHGAMNPAGRLGIRNIAGLELKKDAAERVSSTRGKYEPSKKEPRVGGARGSGRQKGLGGF